MVFRLFGYKNALSHWRMPCRESSRVWNYKANSFRLLQTFGFKGINLLQLNVT